MCFRRITELTLSVSLLVFQPAVVLSQLYTSSGSTGSDGALSFPNAKSGDTIIFDPTTFSPPLDPSHDGIFNFTTITIPAGVTVKLNAQILPGAVYWLASGNVDIEGTLDLSGAAGANATTITSLRIPALPGPGGYPGGVGGSASGNPAESGLGPQGGNAVTNGGCSNPAAGLGENSILVPLFGGSGGGGFLAGAGTIGAGGGAGGGAILIASSGSILINGKIVSNGGAGGGNQGGGGAGGAIRLVAQTISGSGAIGVSGGGSPSCGSGFGANGIVRLEANHMTFSGSIIGNSTSGTPFATFVPTGDNAAPTVKVISVGGLPVNPLPTGSFSTPDVTINSTASVPIVVQGSNVPVGTVVHLQIFSENGPDINVDTPGLTGTLQSSTATVNVLFPTGYSRGYISASFSTSGSN